MNIKKNLLNIFGLTSIVVGMASGTIFYKILIDIRPDAIGHAPFLGLVAGFCGFMGWFMLFEKLDKKLKTGILHEQTTQFPKGA